MDAMDVDHDDQPRMKRFKHQSYNEILKDVHPTAAHNQQRLDVEIEDNDSNFHQALEHWRQLNLAPSFISFANKADSLSASMPLLLHNWKEITDLWIAAFDVADDEGLRALLDLLQKISHDLRTTLSPIYSSLLTRLLNLLAKAISPPALQALLDTLGALFKYLLVPSTNTELLNQTWTSFRETLPKCLPEIQRAAAEVWGNTLRRFKTSMREKAVTLLAEGLEGIEDASAWAIVSASKSVSQTLHTATNSILLTIINTHMTSDDPKPTFTLIRRVVTALVHHVKKAEQFTALADLLIREFIACPKSLEGMDEEATEKLRRWTEVIAIPCAVRQGSRLSQSQLSQVSGELAKIPITPSLRSSLLRFATAIFTASEMQLWLGPGFKFLQRIWSQCTSTSCSPSEKQEALAFTLTFNMALAELNWGGWKLVALPQLLKATSSQEILDMDPGKMARLLAEVKRCKKINEKEADVVWRERVGSWVKARLEGWKDGDAKQDVELDDLLTVSTMFTSGVTHPIINAIERVINSTPSEGDQVDETRSAWVVGACMQGLVDREPGEWAEKVDLSSWTKICVKRWGNQSEVLAGLYALSQASSTTKRTPIPLEEVYPHLQRSLLSHSRALRLNTLRLLGSTLVQLPPGISDVVKRCLQGEEVPLDVQGVRERVLRIGRLGPMLKDGDDLGADISIRWLIAQLKVNLRPIWSPATGAISSLSERFGDIVWKLTFGEITQVGNDDSGRSSKGSDMDIEATEHLDDIWEEERSWRDPSAHKLRETVAKTLDEKYAQSELAKSRIPKERLDIRSYEMQLIATLRECSSLAEKNNRELVPYFFSIAGPDASTKLARTSLSAWLTLFSKFSNPKALHSTDNLLSMWYSLLAHPDRSLQQLALSCVFTYKSPHLLSHQDKLRSLIDETRWRDELTSLDFSSIDPQDRAAFVDVTIRLLFGVMLEKKGRSRGADRRAAVLSTLAGCTEHELALLVDLMLQPFHFDHTSRREGTFAVMEVNKDVSEKQQSGFLNLLADVLKNLGSKLVNYWPALIGTTIDQVAYAQYKIGAAVQEVEDDEEPAEENETDDEPTTASTTSRVVRTIRQHGLKRLADFFRQPVKVEFAPYVSAAYPSFISPRLPSLDIENTQAPSALLELFFTWSCDELFVDYLWRYDATVIPKIYGCLVASSIKPAVINRVFDIVDRLTVYSATNETIRENAVKPHVSLLLTNLGTLIQQTKGSAIATPLAQRQIRILAEIAQYCTNSQQASSLLTLILPLLKRPSKLVAERVKTDLLKTVANLIPQAADLSRRDSDIYELVYKLLSSLFATVRSRFARSSLVAAFQSLANVDKELHALAEILAALNAYSVKRMDEPDFEVRLRAFIELNEHTFRILSCSDWLPLLYNMLHHVQDSEELTIRNNASLSMRHFIDIVASQPGGQFEETFSQVLYPGIKNTLRSKHEMVRSEVLGVLAYAVQKCEAIASLQEMRILLAGGDEEANFFNNILHVQLHRRSRALRRFADHCDEGHLRSSTLQDIFVPLIGWYIVNPATSDHHLVNDAITTLGRTAKHLNWGAYYNLVQKYLKLSRAKDETERVYVRTLVSLLDNFHFPMEDEVQETGGEQVEEDEAADDETASPDAKPTEPGPIPNATQAGKQIARVSDAVNSRLLPTLLSHLETHNTETDDTARIPIAIGIVSVAQHLPASSCEAQTTRLLTVLSQILRSKSQETRDLVRDALCRIAVVLGPSYLPLTFKELRAALLRGPQLHVLAYVVHAILVYVTTGDHASSFTVLDDCVNDVAFVSAEVIFGESGKDVQSEDFKTKMREVRTSSSKGLDSFATIAKFISPNKISSLLAPLRSIMQETESLKVMNLVDEILKRTAGGLNSNVHLVPTELLVLCNTLISQNAKFLKQTVSKRDKGPKGDAIIQLKRQQAVATDHYSSNSYRFVAFGLELFQAALRRNRFDLQDTQVLARLDAMVAVIGNALYSTNSSVLITASRCAAGLAKCPLKSLDKSMPVYISQLLDILRQAGNTDSELAQTVLKSLATMLRDGPSVQVKEKDLIFLLEIITPELEEPERQASSFSMLRAIVARKFVVPEIYDTMDKVSEIMVTSQSPQVQELCRGALLQFLLDYPQGKGRLRKQMTFLAQNLSYVHESGRKSVMELLGAVIAKFQENLIKEYGDLIFVALVMVIANDESSKCREMAAALIKSLFVRLDEQHRRVLLSHLHSWASQEERPQLSQVSSQVYGFIIDVLQQEASPYVDSILEDINSALDRSSQYMSNVNDQEDEAMEIDVEWKGPYNALVVLTKITRVFVDFASGEARIHWPQVVDHLLFPHAWVRLAACRLLGILFTSVPVRSPKESTYELQHPLSYSGMQEAAIKLTIQLKSEHLDEGLGLQIVKNLFYIGKSFLLVADTVEDDDSKEEDVEIDGEDEPGKRNKSLPWLFSNLSYQIRSAQIARRNRKSNLENWHQRPLCVLRWFAAMASHMEDGQLEGFLLHILSPVYRLIEEDIIRDPHLDELKTLATELQDLIQTKVGTTKFSAVYNQIRQNVLGVRRERKNEKAVREARDPEAASKRRITRNVSKKESKKRKQRMLADMHGKSKRRRQD